MDRRDTLKWIGAGAAALAAVRSAHAAPDDKPRRSPTSKEFKDCLTDVYNGEVLGESFFGEMLDAAKSPAEIYVIGSMLQLETEGKATLRPLLARLGMPLRDSSDSRTHGATAGAKLAKLVWAERFAQLRDAIEKGFLPRYLQLADLVSAEVDPEAAYIAAFMGSHERAIHAACAGIAKGMPDAIAPMVRLLRFPLPKP
jgi:hypothetical protein